MPALKHGATVDATLLHLLSAPANARYRVNVVPKLSVPVLALRACFRPIARHKEWAGNRRDCRELARGMPVSGVPTLGS
jgi:hypothetical protein